MNFEKLNKTCLLDSIKSIIKTNELPVNEPIPILSAKIVKTKYGETVLIELENNCTFLPKRVLPFMKDNLSQFTDSKYSIIFRGQKDVNKPTPGITFEFVESEYIL